MKKGIKLFVLLFLFMGLTAMAVHRFYAAIYQIHYVPQKKMVQITTRIFIDDLNEGLKNKFHKNTYLGTDKESPEDVVLMQKYIADNFKITIDGKLMALNYLSKELDDTILVCYFNIKEVKSVKSVRIENSVLTDIFPDQQNIIQYNNDGNRHNLVLTNNVTVGMLN
jgi:hypothetical protein